MRIKQIEKFFLLVIFISILITPNLTIYAYGFHTEGLIIVDNEGSKKMATQCKLVTRNVFLERKDYSAYRKYMNDLESDKIRRNNNLLKNYSYIATKEAKDNGSTHIYIKENEDLIKLTNFQYRPFLFVIMFQCPEIIRETEIKLKKLYYIKSIKGYMDEELDRAIIEFLKDNDKFLDLKKEFTGALWKDRKLLDILNDKKFQEILNININKIVN